MSALDPDLMKQDTDSDDNDQQSGSPKKPKEEKKQNPLQFIQRVTTFIYQRKLKPALLLICDNKLSCNTIFNFPLNFTLLHYACLYDKFYAVSVLLTKFKPNINIKDNNSQTPLHLAATYSSIRIIKLLASYPTVKLEDKDVCNSTPLLNAVKANSLFGFLYLYLEKGADPTIIDVCGCTITHWAAFNNSVEFLSLFKSLGLLNLECKDKQLNTPIFRAIQNSSIKAVKFLLKERISLGELNIDNKTPIQYSNEAKLPKIKHTIEKEEAMKYMKSHETCLFNSINFFRDFNEKSKYWRLSTYLEYMRTEYKRFFFTCDQLYHKILIVILLCYFEKSPLTITLVSIIGLLSFISIYSMCACISSEPGYKKRMTINDSSNALSHILEQIKENEEINKTNFCTYCLLINGEDDSHCRKCNKCVSEYQLHAPLIDTCIGRNNFHYYGRWIIFEYLIFLIVALAVYIQQYYSVPADYSIIQRHVIMFKSQIVYARLAPLAIWVLVCKNALYLLGINLKMLYALSTGTTIHNITRLHKHRAFMQPKKYSNKRWDLQLILLTWKQAISNLCEGLCRIANNASKNARSAYVQLSEVTVDKEENKLE